MVTWRLWARWVLVCAGLVAVTVAASPWWYDGQLAWFVAVIGVAGSVAVATVMAAAIGVGVVRLVARSRRTHPPLLSGRRMFAALLGVPVHDEGDHLLGRVRDLVVDLAVDAERPPVTHLVLHARSGRLAMVPWTAVDARSRVDGLVVGERPRPVSASISGPAELWLRRDVMDSPVITVEPPSRARVSDIALEMSAAGARVSGLDLGARALVQRILRAPNPGHEPADVSLAQVHLGSPQGHAAQLSVEEPAVLELPADLMAEVLTRVPVSHARDIMRAADDAVREDAVRLLHPHVRSRLSGQGDAVRRTRRFHGWRLHRPTAPPRSKAAR